MYFKITIPVSTYYRNIAITIDILLPTRSKKEYTLYKIFDTNLYRNIKQQRYTL